MRDDQLCLSLCCALGNVDPEILVGLQMIRVRVRILGFVWAIVQNSAKAVSARGASVVGTGDEADYNANLGGGFQRVLLRGVRNCYLKKIASHILGEQPQPQVAFQI